MLVNCVGFFGVVGRNCIVNYNIDVLVLKFAVYVNAGISIFVPILFSNNKVRSVLCMLENMLLTLRQ